MVIQKLVKELGGVQQVVDMMRNAGFSCQYAKIHQINSGKRPCSIVFALEIEAATKGRIQALEVMQETLEYWREEKDILRYRRR